MTKLLAPLYALMCLQNPQYLAEVQAPRESGAPLSQLVQFCISQQYLNEPEKLTDGKNAAVVCEDQIWPQYKGYGNTQKRAFRFMNAQCIVDECKKLKSEGISYADVDLESSANLLYNLGHTKTEIDMAIARLKVKKESGFRKLMDCKAGATSNVSEDTLKTLLSALQKAGSKGDPTNDPTSKSGRMKKGTADPSLLAGEVELMETAFEAWDATLQAYHNCQFHPTICNANPGGDSTRGGGSWSAGSSSNYSNAYGDQTR